VPRITLSLALPSGVALKAGLLSRRRRNSTCSFRLSCPRNPRVQIPGASGAEGPFGSLRAASNGTSPRYAQRITSVGSHLATDDRLSAYCRTEPTPRFAVGRAHRYVDPPSRPELIRPRPPLPVAVLSLLTRPRESRPSKTALLLSRLAFLMKLSQRDRLPRERRCRW